MPGLWVGDVVMPVLWVGDVWLYLGFGLVMCGYAWVVGW